MATTSASRFAGDSGAVYSPEKWRPREVYRIVKSEEYPHAVAFVCVLLERRSDEKAQVQLPEPLASVVWFDFGDEAPSYSPWFSRWHSYSPAPSLGEWVTDEVERMPAEERKKHDYKWRFVRGLAIPLAEVTSGDVLKTRLLDPLVADIAQRSKRAEPK